MIGRLPVVRRALQEEIETHANPIVQDAAAIRRVGSTQDHAFEIARSTQRSVCVYTSRQTQGRGQHGRRWFDNGRHSLALSFAFRTDHDAAGLASRAGLAALTTCAKHVVNGDALIQWPNDIVVRDPAHTDAKLAGVLIEQRDGISIVGIGINVSQRQSHFDASIGRACVSLKQCGASVSRTTLACDLLRNFSDAITMTDSMVVDAWAESDALLGNVCRFVHDHVTYEGVVESINPLEDIAISIDDAIVELPVTSTSKSLRDETGLNVQSGQVRADA